ncbi:MAG: LON peptidase substrate-binding domain-containing protein [Bdellovibrionota bacterium]|jgi:Lon protease-like protein|nr:LON peptidase substrate-binding domain-containing protein [Bdellovibrionota bacterium]
MEIYHIPILPLPNIVFFPHTVIPMLISEPSYIRMIKDVLASDGFLGISMAEPREDVEGSLLYSPSRIATMGKPILLEELEDGSLKILVEGRQRIELMHAEQNIPYLVYRVITLPDTKSTVPLTFDSSQVSRLKEILDKWVEDTIEDSLERKSFQESLKGIHPIIDYLSMFMVGDFEVRQLLLENTNLHERIQMLSTLLRGDYPDCEDNLVADAVKDFEFGERLHSFVH